MIKTSRILFVTKSPPWPTDIGGNQRSHLILRALQAIAPTDLVLVASPGDLSARHAAVLRDDYGLVACAGLRAAGAGMPWRLLRPAFPAMTDRLALYLGSRLADYQPDPELAQTARDVLAGGAYGVVVGRQLRVMAKSGLLGFPRTVLDVDDVDVEYYESRSELPDLSAWRRVLLARTVHQLRVITPRLFKMCSALWVTKRRDLETDGLEAARLLPNIPLPQDGRPFCRLPHARECRVIMSVGAFSHRPNVEGVEFFLRDVWPGIIHEIPDARYRIVGGGIEESLKARWSRIAGVEVVGFVKDLENEYRNAAFTVAPLQWGGGTNIKIPESLAYGRTCVITPHAHRGYEADLPHNIALLVAVDAGRFRDECIKLLKDHELRARLSIAGSETVSTMYTYERFRDVVEATIAPLLELAG